MVPKRTYKLKDQLGRRIVDLRDYEDGIIQAYRDVGVHVKVKVLESCYSVYGFITNNQLRLAGKRIARIKEIGRYAHKAGTGRCVFVLCKKEEI